MIPLEPPALTDWIAAVAGGVGALAGGVGLIAAFKAQRAAQQAVETAQAANKLAMEANAISAESNSIAVKANELSEKSNAIAESSAVRAGERDLVEWHCDWEHQTGQLWVVNIGKGEAVDVGFVATVDGEIRLLERESVPGGGDVLFCFDGPAKEWADYEAEVKQYNALGGRALYTPTPFPPLACAVKVKVSWVTPLGNQREATL